MRLVVLAIAAGVIGVSGEGIAEPLGPPPLQLAQSDQSPSAAEGQAEETAEETYESYKAATERKLDEWGDKLEDYDRKARAAGAEAETDVSARLSEAWRDVQDGWERLKATGAGAWRESKAFLDDSWNELQAAWDEAGADRPTTEN